MMLVRRLAFMSLLILCLPGWNKSAAQPNSQVGGGLQYARTLPSGDTELHILTAEGRDVLTFAASECYRISEGLTYYAVSQTENPTHIAIYERATRTLIWEVVWDDEWELDCGIRWESDHILRAIWWNDETGTFMYDRLDVLSHEIVGPFELRPMPPPLPNLAADAYETLYLASPDGHTYVYQYCFSEIPRLTESFGYICNDRMETRIYYSIHEEVVTVLEDMNYIPRLSMETMSTFHRSLLWSPTGRYLAYQTFYHQSPIRIYDTSLRHYVDTASFEIDTSVLTFIVTNNRDNMMWSPDERYLATWLWRVGLEDVEDVALTLFDIETNAFTILENVYRWSSDANWWGWLPDSDAILILQEGTLLRVALDGTVTVFDTDVEYVYAHYVPLDE